MSPVTFRPILLLPLTWFSSQPHSSTGFYRTRKVTGRTRPSTYECHCGIPEQETEGMRSWRSRCAVRNCKHGVLKARLSISIDEHVPAMRPAPHKLRRRGLMGSQPPPPTTPNAPNWQIEMSCWVIKLTILNSVRCRILVHLKFLVPVLILH